MPFATCLPNTCSVESARGILYFAKGTFFLYRRQSQTKRKKNKLNCFLVLAPCMCIDQHNSLVGTKPPAREMGQDMVLLPSKLVSFPGIPGGKLLSFMTNTGPAHRKHVEFGPARNILSKVMGTSQVLVIFSCMQICTLRTRLSSRTNFQAELN